MIGRVSLGDPLVMGASMQARLVHAARGATTESADLAYREIDELRAFDFDGDGEEELLVLGRGLPCATSGDLGCDGPLPLLEIFTFKNGAVGPYAPSVNVVAPPGTPARVAFASAPGKLAEEDRAVTLVSLTDADGDGRPDVTSHLRYELAATDGDVTSYDVAGPLFVGHSLPGGTFSFTDPVAMKALAQTCGNAPTLEQARGAELYAAAVCERLEGHPPAELAERWARRCAVLESERAKQMSRVKSGAQPDATSIDWTSSAVCRRDTEGGWNDVKGMPASVRKMLEETEPLRSPEWTARP